MPSVDFSIHRREDRSLVRLMVRPADAERAVAALHLPGEALRWQGSEPGAIWIGPNQWLLVGEDKNAEEIISAIDRRLPGQLYAATNMSDALCCFAISGSRARTILSMGCALDLTAQVFGEGQCARTRFANVPLVIAATTPDGFDIYVDRGYSDYLQQWMGLATGDPLLETP